MLSQTRLALTAVVFALAIGHMAPARGQTESKVIASDGKSAMDCTALEKISEPNAKSPATQWVLVNRCTDEVEFGWCVDDDLFVVHAPRPATAADRPPQRRPRPVQVRAKDPRVRRAHGRRGVRPTGRIAGRDVQAAGLALQRPIPDSR